MVATLLRVVRESGSESIPEGRWRWDERICAPIEGRSGPVGAHPRRGTARNAGWLSAVWRCLLYTIARSWVFA